MWNLCKVPCGTEKDQKPPKCRKSCHVIPLCRHRSICKVLFGGCISVFCNIWSIFGQNYLIENLEHFWAVVEQVVVFYTNWSCHLFPIIFPLIYLYVFNFLLIIFLFTQPHKCHYGACPPCRLLCEEEYPCGHSCKLRFAETSLQWMSSQEFFSSVITDYIYLSLFLISCFIFQVPWP